MADLLDSDHIFDAVGQFGRYQARFIFMIGSIEFIALGFQLFLMSFAGGEPPWQCSPNRTDCNITGLVYPTDKDIYKLRCDLPPEAWQFDGSYTSIVTEWNLVCDDSILASVTSSMLFPGWLLGVIIFGILSDKFGRKKSLFASMQLCVFVSFISAFSPSITFAIVCRFFIGVGAGACSMINFIMPIEYCGVKHRGTAGTLLWMFDTFGHMLMALVAYLIRDWRYLTMAVSIPGFFCIIYWWFIPESVRWLLVHGKVEEAEKCFRKVAEVNGRPMPEGKLGFQKIAETKDSGNIRDLFRKGRAKTTLILWYSWFSIALVYFGVSYSVTILGGNIYLNFFLGALIEIPGNLGAIWFMNRFGRKLAVVLGMLIAAIAAAIALAFPYNDNPANYAGRLTVALIAKLCVLVAFDSIYVFSGELMPTVARNVGMAMCSAVARIGSFLSLYIIFLKEVHLALPFALIGVVALVAAFLCLLLPETNLQPTPELFDDSDPSQSSDIPFKAVAGEEPGSDTSLPSA